ncbi:MAG: 50S ribosomal protein L24 [Candidatus Coatesbacteria bacterium]|nr:50S ribosomal protein L24 [Candidatus Coatesbacteria bacterium]
MSRITKLRKGDTVEVISGEDRGKRGEILKIFLDDQRAVVQGVNFVKKHQRQTSQDVQGGIIELEAPVRLSNLMLVCPKCGKPSRLGIVRTDGERKRVCKRCDAEFA